MNSFASPVVARRFAFPEISVERTLMRRLLPTDTAVMIDAGLDFDYALALHPELDLLGKARGLVAQLAGADPVANKDVLDSFVGMIHKYGVSSGGLGAAYRLADLDDELKKETLAALANGFGKTIWQEVPGGVRLLSVLALPLAQALLLTAYQLEDGSINDADWANTPGHTCMAVLDLIRLADDLGERAVAHD